MSTAALRRAFARKKQVSRQGLVPGSTRRFCAEMKRRHKITAEGSAQRGPIVLSIAMDKRHRPIEISTFRWSSAESIWADYPVESQVLESHGEPGEYGLDHVLVGLCVGGTGKVRGRYGKFVRRRTSIPGRFSLLGRGFEQKSIAWSGTREMLFVAIGAEQLDRFISHGSDLARLNVDSQHAVSDPHVVSLVRNMWDEIRAGCPTGKLYGETLSLALAAYLFRRYSPEAPPVGRHGLALSPMQVRRVREYIRANLTGDVDLTELANQVNLSPHYFSRLFKQALGDSPHHYVLRERIHEAQKRLTAGRMSISEVALSLGFSDQSHFSQTFRKMTGTTPKRYQSTR